MKFYFKDKVIKRLIFGSRLIGIGFLIIGIIRFNEYNSLDKNNIVDLLLIFAMIICGILNILSGFNILFGRKKECLIIENDNIIQPSMFTKKIPLADFVGVEKTTRNFVIKTKSKDIKLVIKMIKEEDVIKLDEFFTALLDKTTKA